ncbi:MAG: hypothetical protein E7212_02535 [Clostridium sartagoforme]|nr:hypothetical protein [Clostridium sartagoforme]
MIIRCLSRYLIFIFQEIIHALNRKSLAYEVKFREQLCNMMNILKYTKEGGFICFGDLIMVFADLVAVSDLMDVVEEIAAADSIDVVEDFGSSYFS